MDTRGERWAATGTAAVATAVAAATWVMCENLLAWRDSFRLEDLTYARGQIDDFEAYRSGGITESATAWVAVIVLAIAVIVVVVAGVRARRWHPAIAAVCAFCAVVVVVVGAVLPVAPWALPLVVIGATLTLRTFARPAPQSDEVEMAS
jgi:uncharacterized membrane protein YhaH (DUF805 family)